VGEVGVLEAPRSLVATLDHCGPRRSGVLGRESDDISQGGPETRGITVGYYYS
jgi:hypothetical protein